MAVTRQTIIAPKSNAISLKYQHQGKSPRPTPPSAMVYATGDGEAGVTACVAVGELAVIAVIVAPA